VSQTDGPEPVGSVAEEAVKLLGALSGWAREQGDGVSAAAGAFTGSMTDGLHEHLATGDAACAWCPVCRTVTAIRQTSPEVKTHLTSAASSLLMAVSGMMATHPPARDGGVEHIDLDADETDDTPGSAGSFDDWSEDLT
jgi:hypothetical protein